MWWGAPFMANETPSRFSMIRNLAVLLALWEVAGRFQLVASGALPAPSAICAISHPPNTPP